MATKMRSLWLFFLVGLTTGFIGEKLFVLSQSTATDDLYIEDQASGDYPVDDEDGEDQSGSGSGDYGEMFRLLNISKEIPPFQPQPPTAAPSTTVSDSQDSALATMESEDEMLSRPTITGILSVSSTSSPSEEETTTAEVIVDPTLSNFVEEDTRLVRILDNEEILVKEDGNEIYASGRDSRFRGVGSKGDVTYDNLWERTEVLAAVIACGVVGFLCAVFLLLLLAYRMKKKDEGSYDLGDNKLSATAYHKAPTKEFYA